MIKYGPIGGANEMKLLQENMYKEIVFIGFDKNRIAYIHVEGDTRKLTKSEVKELLSLNDDQLIKIYRHQGRIDFSDSFGGTGTHASSLAVKSENVDKQVDNSEKTIRGRKNKDKKATKNEDEGMDIPVGRENPQTVVDVVNNPNEGEDDFLDIDERIGEDGVPADGEDLVPSKKLENRSLKNQVRDLKKRVVKLEQNIVTKDQLIEILKTLKEGGSK